MDVSKKDSPSFGSPFPSAAYGAKYRFINGKDSFETRNAILVIDPISKKGSLRILSNGNDIINMSCIL